MIKVGDYVKCTHPGFVQKLEGEVVDIKDNIVKMTNDTHDENYYSIPYCRFEMQHVEKI